MSGNIPTDTGEQTTEQRSTGWENMGDIKELTGSLVLMEGPAEVRQREADLKGAATARSDVADALAISADNAEIKPALSNEDVANEIIDRIKKHNEEIQRGEGGRTFKRERAAAAALEESLVSSLDMTRDIGEQLQAIRAAADAGLSKASLTVKKDESVIGRIRSRVNKIRGRVDARIVPAKERVLSIHDIQMKYKAILRGQLQAQTEN